jgi:hypothetical protein
VWFAVVCGLGVELWLSGLFTFNEMGFLGRFGIAGGSGSADSNLAGSNSCDSSRAKEDGIQM